MLVVSLTVVMHDFDLGSPDPLIDERLMFISQIDLIHSFHEHHMGATSLCYKLGNRAITQLLLIMLPEWAFFLAGQYLQSGFAGLHQLRFLVLGGRGQSRIV